MMNDDQEQGEIFSDCMGNRQLLQKLFTRRPILRDRRKGDSIASSRGAFKWLPVYCSNDLVHASWWFVWGSVFGTLVSIFPLCHQYIPFLNATATTLPMLEFPSTWGLLIVSGVFFTLGSLAFVRAFEDPPLDPLFKSFKHFATDELLGAWLYLLGTIPAVPYSAVFIAQDPSQIIYWGALIASVIFVICTSMFVVVCYPSAKELLEPFCQPIALSIFGQSEWIRKHFASDWLVATWFFLYATLLWCIASLALLCIDYIQRNGEEIFVWSSSVIDSLFFLIGCGYFVAGSYPSGATNTLTNSNYEKAYSESSSSHFEHSNHNDTNNINNNNNGNNNNSDHQNDNESAMSDPPLAILESNIVNIIGLPSPDLCCPSSR